MNEMKTINEWSKYFKIKILDPDGFNRSDPDLHKKKFTEREFKERLSYCTVDNIKRYLEIMK